MANIPTLKDLIETNKVNLESRLGQEAPLNDKAFVKVLAVVLAIVEAGQYKYAVERIKQNLIRTATGDNLKELGLELDVVFKTATATVLQALLGGTNGTVILQGTKFTGVLNDVVYITNSTVVILGGVATLDLTAQTVGSIGNLTNGSELAIHTQIPGANTIATVYDTLEAGIEDEDQEVYRERVLFAYRAVLGAGTASDYKTWAEIVIGVKRVYPFTGRTSPISACPGDRTVYVEATTDIDPDGIAPGWLLDDVRDAINTSPDGKEQTPLGLEDSLLFIESIVRSSFFVKVTGLVVESAKEAALKADISAALSKYFRESVRPYVVGIDSVFERNDVVTQNFVSDVVADPLRLYSATCGKVEFSKTSGVPTPLLTYTLENNELAKLGGITYV